MRRILALLAERFGWQPQREHPEGEIIALERGESSITLDAKPGKSAEYRKAWEKYNKPVLDKLMADGVILVYGLAVEDIRTEGSFTHFTWYDMKDLASMDKIRAAFLSDRDHRSQEEQDAITNLFAGLTDTDAFGFAFLRS